MFITKDAITQSAGYRIMNISYTNFSTLNINFHRTGIILCDDLFNDHRICDDSIMIKESAMKLWRNILHEK